jgi:hypothetical protein
MNGYLYTQTYRRRFAYPCNALHSTAMAKPRGRRKQLMMQ